MLALSPIFGSVTSGIPLERVGIRAAPSSVTLILGTTLDALIFEPVSDSPIVGKAPRLGWCLLGVYLVFTPPKTVVGQIK